MVLPPFNFEKGCDFKVRKWFKRLLPVVMAIMLCFGSCLTAFAANELDSNQYWFSFVDSNGVECFYTADYPFVAGDNGYISCQSFKVYKNGQFESISQGSVCSLNGLSIMESSHNILYEDGTIFFQLPSPILEPIVAEAGMEKVLETIMIILPTGLVCLVGWIALRKALSLLQGILHQA